MLHIGPLQKVGGARLQRDGPSLCQDISAIGNHPYLDIQVPRRALICCQIQADGVAVLPQQGVILQQELALGARQVLVQPGGGRLAEEPAEGDDATEAVHQVGKGAALVALHAAVEDDDARDVARVVLERGTVSRDDFEKGLQEFLDFSGDLTDTGFLRRRKKLG